MITKRGSHFGRDNVATDENVIITLMGKFSYIVGTKRIEPDILRSKKGFNLLTYLIVNRDSIAPLKTLYEIMWPDEQSENPENALKTQISRIRTLLNRFLPGMGDNLINIRGGYGWKCPDYMKIDLYEIEDLLSDMLRSQNDDEKITLGKQLSRLYKGDLLIGGDCKLVRSESARIRVSYISAMHSLIDIFKARGEYDEIIKICREGLEADAFNEMYNSELMNALAQTDRTIQALDQYKHAADLHCRYRSEQPSLALQRSYKQLTYTGGSLDVSLMKIMRDLSEHSVSSGAFICEYSVFREVYGLQMRNLERMGKAVFLSIVMVSDMDGKPLQPLLQSEVMRGTLSILSHNLRRGDTITQISPTLFAMLLPSVDYTTGNAVIERIRSAFFLRYPNSGIVFSYRLSPLEKRSDPRTDISANDN